MSPIVFTWFEEYSISLPMLTHLSPVERSSPWVSFRFHTVLWLAYAFRLLLPCNRKLADKPQLFYSEVTDVITAEHRSPFRVLFNCACLTTRELGSLLNLDAWDNFTANVYHTHLGKIHHLSGSPDPMFPWLLAVTTNADACSQTVASYSIGTTLVRHHIR